MILFWKGMSHRCVRQSCYHRHLSSIMSYRSMEGMVLVHNLYPFMSMHVPAQHPMPISYSRHLHTFWSKV